MEIFDELWNPIRQLWISMGSMESMELTNFYGIYGYNYCFADKVKKSEKVHNHFGRVEK
jgi:hypothetical protein